MEVIHCSAKAHVPAVLDILNEAIAHSTALYEYQPRTPQNLRAWFAEKKAARFPVIGMEQAGALLGFATYGSFRARAAYKYTVEHSVYVHRDHRGRGIGMALMRELIGLARQQQYHVLVGGIDVANAASARLHERLGFTHAGTIRQAAFKFGRWLDLGFYQLVLETPANPVDG
jgi:L-amino acid N-acyltransferase YncA